MTTGRHLPTLLTVLALAAFALVALALPSTAMASKCGEQVLQDWADNGRIDRVYALQCYQDALRSIPADIEDYTNAHEIISRALAERASNNGDPGDPTDPAGQPGSSGGSDDPDNPGREPAGPVTPGGPAVTPAVDTSEATSVPIPLLLLAAMSLLLLGAGGLGYLSRRRNGAADGLNDGPGDDELPPSSPA